MYYVPVMQIPYSSNLVPQKLEKKLKSEMLLGLFWRLLHVKREM